MPTDGLGICSWARQSKTLGQGTRHPGVFHKPGGDEHGGEFAATYMDGGAKEALARASDRDK